MRADWATGSAHPVHVLFVSHIVRISIPIDVRKRSCALLAPMTIDALIPAGYRRRVTTLSYCALQLT